ncbi:MAG: MFS transporter [Fibrobacteria bacterium]|nr:MFS transporter [Fibrobacteria bacterium]
MATGYFSFLKSRPYDVGYLLLHSFTSSFGQTFFIALFVPHFRSQFALSSAQFGLMYSMATFLNALIFPFAGAYLDKISIRKFSTGTGILILLACLVLAFAPGVAALFMGLTLIRLAGQSLMTHISAASGARAFGSDRGKALSVINLGFPIGEGLLPPVVGLILSRWGNSFGFILLGISLVAVFFPLSRFLYKKSVLISGQDHELTTSEKTKKIYRFDLLLKPKFILLVPSMVCPPFLLTGYFLHQASLATMLNWPALWVATWFFLYAFSRIAASFVIGPLTDRYTAVRLYPFYLFPIVISMFMLFLWDSSWACLVFLIGSGVTMGTGSTLKNALLPELFGTKSLGAIRSLSGMLMAIATALSPWLFGILIDGNRVSLLLISSISVIAGSYVLSLIGLKINRLSR